MLNSRQALCELIPHEFNMCLLDRVVDYDQDNIVCATKSHLSGDNPFLENGEIHGISTVEYAAQAAAIHSRISPLGGLQGQKSGFLAQVKNIILHKQNLSGFQDDLIVQANKIHGEESFLIYSIEVSHQESQIIEGQVMIVLTDATQ